MIRRRALDDNWPGPWPTLGTGPAAPASPFDGPRTNNPTAYDGYMQYKAWRRWREGEKHGRWRGTVVRIIFDSRDFDDPQTNSQ